MPEMTPRKALKGLQPPGMGQPVAQDVPGWQQRCREQGVGTPLTPGRGTNSCSDNNHDMGGCTGAVTSPQQAEALSRAPLGSPLHHHLAQHSF